MLAWDFDGMPWRSNFDDYSYHKYGDGQLTLLDLAFRDRLQMWKDLVEKHNAQTQLEMYDMMSDFLSPSPKARLYFEHDGDRYYEPSEPPLATEPTGGSMFKWDKRVGGVGPDGKGEDKLIKTAAQFIECCEEIVAQLSSLETFRWNTYITPMPPGIFESLAKLTSLKRFHPGLTLDSGIVHARKCCIHARSSRRKDMLIALLSCQCHSGTSRAT